MMTFKSKRDLFSSTLFMGIIIFLIILIVLTIMDDGYSLKSIMISVFLFVVSAFMFWIWNSTYYIIDEQYLFYRSGPINGKIEIHKIVKINKNKVLWAGFRPALSTKGILITYQKYSKIYVSPIEQEKFINTLLSINKSIDIYD